MNRMIGYGQKWKLKHILYISGSKYMLYFSFGSKYASAVFSLNPLSMKSRTEQAHIDNMQFLVWPVPLPDN